MSQKSDSVFIPMGAEIWFELPLTKSMNVTLRQHRFARHNYYNKIYEDVAWLTKDQRPKAPWEKIELVITRHAPRLLDFDNLVASLKPVVDGLVRAKIISDDNWNVTGPWIINQRKSTKWERPGITVRILLKEVENG